MPHAYVAFDLGAESGRAMLAILDGQTLQLEEAHRFANVPQRLPSGYHWSLTEIWRNLIEGLRKCGELAKQRGVELTSLGVDTWGVDFGLIGKSGQLLGLPFVYRDPRHARAYEKTLQNVGRDVIYNVTGIQFMPLNSLYQLVADNDSEPGMLEHATTLLFMPDLLHYFFCGRPINEATIASTSQMIDVHNGGWAIDLLTSLGLPTHFLGTIVSAGTVIGELRDEVAEEAGVPRMKVTAPASHDTASAVAAVPVDVDATPNWAYISSGTWSLLGAEIDEPIVTEQALQANFTNERGVADRIRLLRNIAGLWLVQECRRDYARRGESYDYAELTRMAKEAEPFRTLVDPAHAPFALPGDMPAKIAAFARETGQPEPTTPGQFVRCCLESLAMCYRRTLEELETLLGRRMDVMHIVGGGGQNTLLNQMAADAINRPVVVGPYEATAIGNALTQALGTGQVRDLAHLRAIVRNSFKPETYQPQNPDAFDQQYDRYLALTNAEVAADERG